LYSIDTINVKETDIFALEEGGEEEKVCRTKKRTITKEKEKED
jgi:hypothetical protein